LWLNGLHLGLTLPAVPGNIPGVDAGIREDKQPEAPARSNGVSV
jgi:hypothetical protein